MSKRNAKDQIALGDAVRQLLGPMIGQLNTAIATARATLNVPADWVMVSDKQGVPAGFVPPEKPEGPKAVVTKAPKKTPKKPAKRG